MPLRVTDPRSVTLTYNRTLPGIYNLRFTRGRKNGHGSFAARRGAGDLAASGTIAGLFQTEHRRARLVHEGAEVSREQ